MAEGERVVTAALRPKRRDLLVGPGGAGSRRIPNGDTTVVVQWCSHGKIAPDGQVDCAYCREVQHVDVVEGKL